jgi:hypothetical protein
MSISKAVNEKLMKIYSKELLLFIECDPVKVKNFQEYVIFIFYI